VEKLFYTKKIDPSCWSWTARVKVQAKGQLTFVIQSRDSEQNTKLNNACNAALYHKRIIKIRALLDELFILNM